MKFSTAILVACLSIGAASGAAFSQSPASPPAPSIAPAMLHIPEGTELTITFKDAVSSKSAAIGDVFTISSDEPVNLAGGAVLPGGLIGAGEVTSVHRKGMMGKPGDLNVRLNYLKIGSQRLKLRGNKGAEGNASVGATVALTVIFGPLGLLKHGHDVDIDAGQKLKAYVDQDLDVPLPIGSVGAASSAP